MSAEPPINLEYRMPSPRGAGPKYLVSRLITSYIGYLIVMAVLTLIVPRFANMFEDFKLALPTPTAALVALSRLCIRYYLWAVCLPLPALWAYANYNITHTPTRRGLRLVAFILVILFLVAAITVLLIPTMDLMNGVSGSTTKK